jgi:hypothetical protein
MTLRGLSVCLMAALVSLALGVSAAPYAMTNCEPATTHADASHARHGEHDSGRHHGPVSQCCQAACAACIGILPPSLEAWSGHSTPAVTAALLPALYGVSIPPILAPPKRNL